MLNQFQTDGFYSSVVHEIYKLINEQVIFTNDKGYIIASTDPSRIGQFHEGALVAMQNKINMKMTEELTIQLQGVRKGVVLPILIEEQPLGAIGITGDPNVVQPYAMLVQKVTELLIRDFMIQSNQERHARELEFFVFDWLHSKEPDSQLIERAGILNLQLEKYEQVIVLQYKHSGLQLTYKDLNIMKQLWNKQSDALFIRWGQDKILLLHYKIEKEKLKQKLNKFVQQIRDHLHIEVKIGVGQPAAFNQLSVSLSQAERACMIAASPNIVVFEDELKLELILHELNNNTKTDLIERTIGSIIQDESLLESMDLWFQSNMSLQTAAEKLHIHKNTLQYRLKKIEQLTGLNLNSINDLVLLYMCYRFIKR